MFIGKGTYLFMDCHMLVLQEIWRTNVNPTQEAGILWKEKPWKMVVAQVLGVSAWTPQRANFYQTLVFFGFAFHNLVSHTGFGLCSWGQMASEELVLWVGYSWQVLFQLYLTSLLLPSPHSGFFSASSGPFSLSLGTVICLCHTVNEITNWSFYISTQPIHASLC